MFKKLLILCLVSLGTLFAQAQPTNYTGLQWDQGMDDNKPGFCQAPGFYYATDTLKQYQCDVTGHLTLVTTSSSGTFSVAGCGLLSSSAGSTISNTGPCPSASVGGTADAITATYSPVRTSLFTGEMLSFTPTAPNATTTPTFAPDGLTAHTIVRPGAAALVAGDIATSVGAILKYDAAGTVWELQNPQTLQFGSSFGNFPATLQSLISPSDAVINSINASGNGQVLGVNGSSLSTTMQSLNVNAYTAGNGSSAIAGYFDGICEVGSGNLCLNANGLISFADVFSGNVSPYMGAVQAGIGNEGNGTVDNAWIFHANTGFNGGGGVIVSLVAYYTDSQCGLGGVQNAYSFWDDAAGVRRIKDDSAFDSVCQAIEAEYNPQFTKYTPGTPNYERLILGEWNGNVAEIGTYAGGTGTVRDTRILAPALHIGSASNIANTTFAGAGVNDGVFNGTYTGSTHTYCAVIDATGTPDTFSWGTNGACDDGATGVPITGANQTLSSGVVIKFATTTGHTLADKWSVVATAAADYGSLSASALSFDALKTTGSATGKKVVCVDTATGIMYTSSTGTDCSN